MLEFARRVLRTRYVLFLEEEVVRLRAENRALTNSLLGTAGFPPLEMPAATPPVARIRKRSWQQIQARKEMESQASRESKRP